MANPQTLQFTEQNALVVALKFINRELRITNSALARTYGLRRATLEDIANKGIYLSRYHKKYMRIFIKVINGKKRQMQLLTNNNAIVVMKIKDLFYDLMLIENGIPTDSEINVYERIQKYVVR